MFKIDRRGSVTGNNGVINQYSVKSYVKISILGDKDDQWNNDIDFIVDTGASITLMHTSEAERLGIDITKYDDESLLSGIKAGSTMKLFIKRSVMIKIGHFPPLPISIGFSSSINPNLRLLGRKTFLSRFGIAMDNTQIGIFPKIDI